MFCAFSYTGFGKNNYANKILLNKDTLTLKWSKQQKYAVLVSTTLRPTASNHFLLRDFATGTHINFFSGVLMDVFLQAGTKHDLYEDFSVILKGNAIKYYAGPYKNIMA